MPPSKSTSEWPSCFSPLLWSPLTLDSMTWRILHPGRVKTSLGSEAQLPPAALPVGAAWDPARRVVALGWRPREMGHRPGSAHSWLPLFTPLSSHLWGAGVGQPLIHLLVCSFIPLIHFRCYFPVFHLCEFITERVAREVNTQFSVSVLSVVTGEFLGCWESPSEELRRVWGRGSPGDK